MPPTHDLGLPPGTPADEVKRAFRRAALAWHPDRNAHPDAARRFRRLHEEYQRLLQAAPKPRPRLRPWDALLNELLDDVRRLVDRWPSERWARPTDGLPAVVWVASILDVAGAWTPDKTVTEPTLEGIARGLERLMRGVEPATTRREQEQRSRTLVIARQRLAALERPRRQG